MRASFVGRVESNHTAFIRIKTNREDKDEILILPVEVEVSACKWRNECTAFWIYFRRHKEYLHFFIILQNWDGTGDWNHFHERPVAPFTNRV